MKHYSLKPIHVDLHPSRRLAALLGAAALCASSLAAMLPLPLRLRLALGLALVLAALYHVARDALLRMPWSAARIEVTAKGELRWMTRVGEWSEASVLGSSYVMPWLTVLNLQLPERHFARHVILLPDMMDAESFRRLRVWLRWGSQSPAET